MVDVLVLCEGQTEREFCRTVIAPYLAGFGVSLAGTLVGKPQRKKGGVRDWVVYRNELLRLGKERRDRRLCVLVDFYAMPHSWPGRSGAPAQSIDQRGLYVENALQKDLEAEIGGRFHPCVQLHEFESLLFVDPAISALSIALGAGFESERYVSEEMKKILHDASQLVERIDDSPETAPSKRILRIVKGYDKAAWGVPAVAAVAMDVLRAGCPWLNRWVGQLCNLGAPASA